MTVYLIGNVLGRALFSYLLVWLVIFLFKKFKWKPAFQATNSIKGCTIVGLLFALPLLNQMGAAL